MSPFKKLLFIILFISSTQLIALPGIASIVNDTIQQDSSSFIIINKILIVGNSKTKQNIIIRELNFHEGDTINKSNIESILSKSRNRIFNTNLFVTVDLILVDKTKELKDVLILVKERWYIYPLPIFELADRNFNEWWKDRNRDPERINFGINYIQRNMRGRNETLKAKLQLGFTKKFELFYAIPYINQNQKSGLNLDISYIINKQIPYKTSQNKLVYFDSNHIIRNKFRAGFLYSYRNKFYQTHSIGANYNYNNIGDTIVKLNPQYLLDSQSTQQYFGIKYTFVNDLRDIAYYPLKGTFFRGEIEKLGIGIFNDINQLNLLAEFDLYKKLARKIYFAGEVKQKISFPKQQAYLTTRALGYDKDYVSGYELYVIDGQLFSLLKLNLKWQFYSTKKEVAAVPVNQFETIPLAIYFRIYSDAGYVRDNTFNPANIKLSNTWLIGGGAGIDFVTYYDFVFRTEYSINRLGQHGFFLHLKSAI